MNSRRRLVHELLDDAAAAWPEKTAIETKSESVTFARLQAIAVDCAHRLRTQGVERGERAVVEAENAIDTIAAIFALSALGAAFCPIHPSMPPRQRAYISENSGAAVIVHRVNGGLVSQGASGEDCVLPIGTLSEAGGDGGALRDIRPETISEDLACLIYTSGSTGRPKGVTCLHRQVMFAIEAIADSLDYREDDKIFLALPFSFDYGLYQVFLALSCGATLHLADPRVAGLSLFKELSSTRASVLPAVPPMLNNLAALAQRQPGRLQALRLITNTGAAVAPATVQELRESIPSLTVQLMYGLTECKRATISPPDADIARPGTCGLPLRDTEIRIVDDEGRPVPNGEVGEIVVRGPHVMAGYWNDQEENAKRYVVRHSTMRELKTGDYGWLDDNGFLYCQGRRDDIFKQRGFRVSASEVEAAACAMGGIKHAVLVPPDDKKPSVLLVCFDEAEFDVAARLREELEDYKLPARYMALPEFPTTASGKFDRQALKSMAHSGNRRQTGGLP